MSSVVQRSSTVLSGVFESCISVEGIIGHFTTVCLHTKPLSGSEAQGDLVLIHTLLLLICKSFCCYANKFLVPIMSRSTQTSL